MGEVICGVEIKMSTVLEYRGYVGSIEFSNGDSLFYGKVEGIRSLISYEGVSEKELVDAFHDAVDDYLETCAEEGIKPEQTKL